MGLNKIAFRIASIGLAGGLLTACGDKPAEPAQNNQPSISASVLQSQSAPPQSSAPKIGRLPRGSISDVRLEPRDRARLERDELTALDCVASISIKGTENPQSDFAKHPRYMAAFSYYGETVNSKYDSYALGIMRDEVALLRSDPQRYSNYVETSAQACLDKVVAKEKELNVDLSLDGTQDFPANETVDKYAPSGEFLSKSVREQEGQLIFKNMDINCAARLRAVEMFDGITNGTGFPSRWGPSNVTPLYKQSQAYFNMLAKRRISDDELQTETVKALMRHTEKYGDNSWKEVVDLSYGCIGIYELYMQMDVAALERERKATVAPAPAR